MDNIKKTVLIITTAFILNGCALPAPSSKMQAIPYSPNNIAEDAASVQLAEAAASISNSLTQLSAMEKVEAPPINYKCLPYPTGSDLCQQVSMDWSGPIEPLLRRIAWMTNFSLHVIGSRPPIPVLVTISAQNTPVGYILRDANFQAASKASVVVYPGVRIIELRYGRS